MNLVNGDALNSPVEKTTLLNALASTKNVMKCSGSLQIIFSPDKSYGAVSVYFLNSLDLSMYDDNDNTSLVVEFDNSAYKLL